MQSAYCGDDGSNGTNGTNCVDGLNSLVSQITIGSGAQCMCGGVRVGSGIDSDSSGTCEKVIKKDA